jgi:peptidyl-prolyl cis-trans isomerase SurA
MRAPFFTFGLIAATAIGAGSMIPLSASAQDNPFAQVLSVNGHGISGYEINQRALLISLLGASADPRKQAEDDLILDRLRMDAAKRANITVSSEQIATGMSEFAARANMDTDAFLQAIAGEGVAPQTFRDFVEAGLAWRDVVRSRYAGKITISDAQLQRAMDVSAERGKGTRLLMQEFIIPTQPENMAEASAIAAQVSNTTNEATFGAFARKYSATASREAGGRLPWTDLTSVPPALRTIMLGLEPGATSEPLTIPNAIAVFRLRAIDEEGAVATGEQTLDYAEYLIPSIATPEGQTALTQVKTNVDTCDDLYGLNKGQDAARLTRETRELPQIPADVALELSHLDANEMSTAITRGPNSVVVMLCSRTRPEGEGRPTRAAVLDQLTNDRVAQFAQADEADMRANAVIKR